MFPHLSKGAALLIEPLKPPCRSRFAKGTNDLLTLGLVTERGRTAGNYVEGGGIDTVLAHVLNCFCQLMRLQPKYGPWDGARSQFSERTGRQFQWKHAVPLRRPPHWWLVRPESRDPDRHAPRLDGARNELDTIDMKEIPIVTESLTPP
jgi:hypothetical protein